jgi:apolipoprotein N-acyltransferase
MEPEVYDPKKQKPSNGYLKFSGIAFQFLGVISFFCWLGWKIDRFLGLNLPVFLLLLVFISFFGMMYKLYKDLKS